MFQGCFTYEKKGPCYIWEAKTAQEKRARTDDLAARNALREPIDRKKQEELQQKKLDAFIAKHGRRPRGRKAQQKHTEKNRAYVVKKGRGGINQYRYQEVILKKKLLPFAKECQVTRLGTIVQEDGAPAYTLKHQQEVFDLFQVMRLLWPGNSPDLNAIEPTWFWIKKETSKDSKITRKKKLRQAWLKCWQDLP